MAPSTPFPILCFQHPVRRNEHEFAYGETKCRLYAALLDETSHFSYSSARLQVFDPTPKDSNFHGFQGSADNFDVIRGRSWLESQGTRGPICTRCRAIPMVVIGWRWRYRLMEHVALAHLTWTYLFLTLLLRSPLHDLFTSVDLQAQCPHLRCLLVGRTNGNRWGRSHEKACSMQRICGGSVWYTGAFCMRSAGLNPLLHHAMQAQAHVMAMVNIGEHAAIHFRCRVSCLHGRYGRRYWIAGAIQLRWLLTMKKGQRLH